MANDDIDINYKEMASPKQTVVYKQPSSPGHQEIGSDTRQTQLSQAQQHLQQSLQQQQQGIVPVRPSRSRQHGGSRRADPGGGCGDGGQVQQTSTAGVVALPAGSRGPRSLYLRREEDSFGFTLRHFIVYPPVSITASDGRHAAVGALREPMETIFVKQVYENSPAHRAGLHHGDRLVSVNGYSLNGKTYAQVVQLIQNSPPYLHLLVVPKEDDVLQKFFPEAAHNPESNQRPKRYASPETFSPRRQQQQQQNNDLLKYRPIVYPSSNQQQQQQPQVTIRSRAPDSVSWRSYEEPTYSSIEQHRNSLHQPYQLSPHVQQYRDTKSSEQLYSVPKDNLLYRAIAANPPRAHRSSLRDSLEEGNIYAEPYVHDLSQRPRAQPQVPGGHYRNMGRRASEGSNISSSEQQQSPRSGGGGGGSSITYNYDSSSDYPECSSLGSESLALSDMVVNSSKMKSASKVAYPSSHHHMAASDTHSQTTYTSADSSSGVPCGLQGLSYVNSAGCRLSLDAGRRESSASLNSSLADGSKDSLSSYDSASTLTGQDTDDSIIMSRFRKSFEKKEEFLRRPSQPTGWKTTPDDKLVAAVIQQREFYGRPQKLQKEWPPNEPSLNGQEVSLSSSSSSSSPAKNSMKPSHQNLQRVKVDIDCERDYLNSPQNGNNDMRNDMQMARNRFYEAATGQPVPQLQRNSNIRQSKDKNSFVTTLSRIHEGTPTSTTENGDERILMNGAQQLDVDERRYPVPANLQIVSRRTRQFESGRPVPEEEEDGSLSDRTNFYRSELSRLSSKRVVPNVAVRKREFETLEIENNKDYRRERDSNRRPQRESRSLDNSGTKDIKEENKSSGNRVIPIGSKHLHCLPPNTTTTSDVPLPFENDHSHVHLRARSNSAESWTAALQNSSSNTNSSNINRNVNVDVADDKYRQNKVGRQDSYVSALKSKVPDEDRIMQSVYVEQEDMDIGPHVPENIVPSVVRMQQNPVVSITPATPIISQSQSQPQSQSQSQSQQLIIRPNQLTITSPIRPANANTNATINADTSVHTFGDVSANRLSASPVPGDVPPQVIRRTKNTNSIGDEDRATRRTSYLKATWGDRMHVESDLDLSDNESPQALRRYRRWKPPKFPMDINPIRLLFEEASISALGRSGQRQGTVACKILELEGKRANDRSWHKVWAVLNGPHLLLYKDRNHQSPMGLVETDQQIPGGVDMRYSAVNVADDYTKRKNVLRISSAYPYRAELLLQADSPVEMADWVRTLQEQTGASTEEEKSECMSESKQAQPQQIPATTSIQVQGTARLSPQPSHKSKISTFRNRSPTGQSPKSKTWRGRVVKQFKKLNQGSGSPNSPTTPEKLTFGIPLEHCQKSLQNEFVPRFVEMCTEIIEERGLEVIGIYRVPGNNAAVSALTEELNKGVNLALQDVRSSDTNVVSSLLKSFFRKLPDSLLTSELYPLFIEADKFDDPKERLHEIKKLLNELPDHQYSTLKHLVLHLKKVVDNSEVNKMEARNLAIVFGPTLVRNVEDNMVTMVTDMSHQCRIVESLLLYAEWFFNDDDAEVLNFHINIPQDVASVEMDNTSATVNNSLLLGNISKIEAKNEASSREKKDIMSSIISAANKKIQRKSRKTATDHNNSTKEEVTTPTSDSKDSSIVPLLPQLDEQKQVSLDSEESSSSDNVIPEDPLLMTYPQLEAKTNERVEKFRQETMAMLQQKRRSDSSRTFNTNTTKLYSQNGDSHVHGHDTTDNQTSSDLLATITSVFDNKIKALQSPTHNNCLTVADNIPYADESPDVTLTSFDTTIVEGAKTFINRLSDAEAVAEKMSPKSFRNPSLHKNFSTNLNLNITSNNGQTIKSIKKNYDKEKDVDEQENTTTTTTTTTKANRATRTADELNELCKINFNLNLNKELKCSASDSKLKRSESLNKSDNRECEEEEEEDEEDDVHEHGKLKRSVSLNRAADRLKRSDSLTKYEKTESNINLRRELADDTNRRLKKVSTKLKRKNGMPERSIKRRHTVGGTKDFDRIHWLDNRLRDDVEETAANATTAAANEEKEKLAMRSSSPDLTCAEKMCKDAGVVEDTKLPLESHI